MSKSWPWLIDDPFLWLILRANNAQTSGSLVSLTIQVLIMLFMSLNHYHQSQQIILTIMHLARMVLLCCGLYHLSVSQSVRLSDHLPFSNFMCGPLFYYQTGFYSYVTNHPQMCALLWLVFVPRRLSSVNIFIKHLLPDSLRDHELLIADQMPLNCPS